MSAKAAENDAAVKLPRYYDHGNRRYCIVEASPNDMPAFSVLILEDEPGIFKPLLVELVAKENCRLAMTMPFGNESFDLVQKGKASFGNPKERQEVTIESPEKELVLVFLDLRLAPDAGQHFRSLSKLEEAGWDFWKEIRSSAEGRINIASRYTREQIDAQAKARGLHLEKPNYIPILHKAGEDGLNDETRMLFLERLRGFQNTFRKNSFHIQPYKRQIRVTFYHDTRWEISGWRHCEQTYAYVTHWLLAGKRVKLEALTAFKEKEEQSRLIDKWNNFCKGICSIESLDEPKSDDEKHRSRPEKASYESQETRQRANLNDVYAQSEVKRNELKVLEKKIALTVGRKLFEKADREGSVNEVKRELEKIRDTIFRTRDLLSDLNNNHRDPKDRLRQLKALCPSMSSSVESCLLQLGRNGWGNWINMFVEDFLELLSNSGEARDKLNMLFGSELEDVCFESGECDDLAANSGHESETSTGPVEDVGERITLWLFEQLAGWIAQRDALSKEVSQLSGAKIEARKIAKAGKKGYKKKIPNPLAGSIAKQFHRMTDHYRIVGLLNSFGCPHLAMHLEKAIKIGKEPYESEGWYDGNLEWHISPEPPVLPPNYDETAPFHCYLMKHSQTAP